MPKKRRESPIRVLLIAHRTLIRLGIRTLLKGHFKIDRIDEVLAPEALDAIARIRPDLIVYDVDDAQGDLDFVRAVTCSDSGVALIVLTGRTDAALVRDAYSAGASAVVLKQLPADSLISAIRKVLTGDVWLDRAMLDAVLDESSTSVSSSATIRPLIGNLTKRESDVVRAIAKGYRNKQIAAELGISEVTVRHHLTAIFGKLQVSDRLGLLIQLYNSGLPLQDPQHPPVICAS